MTTGNENHQRSAYQYLRGLALVIHLFPAVMNAAAALIFYLIAADPASPPAALALALSVFLISSAVGSMNDYLDVELDRATKPAKPIVRDDISQRTAFGVSVGSAVIGVGLSFLLGFPAGSIALLVLASGLAYDVWLKGTLWSWLPYAIGIPALPVWSFLAADAFTPVLLLSFPLGALIALALQLANTVPDIEGDRSFGVVGLAHRLGVNGSLVVIWVCFALSIGLLAMTPQVLGNDPALLFPGIAAGAVLLTAMILDTIISRSHARFQRGWYMSAVLGGVLGIAWVLSLPTA